MKLYMRAIDVKYDNCCETLSVTQVCSVLIACNVPDGTKIPPKRSLLCCSCCVTELLTVEILSPIYCVFLFI